MSVIQPQSHVVTIIPQQGVVNQRNNVQAASSQQEKKKFLVGLGIAEVIAGSLCVILGAIITGYPLHEYRDTYKPPTPTPYRYNSYRSSLSYNSYYDSTDISLDNYNDNYNYYYSYYNYRRLNIGEGIWCGIWGLLQLAPRVALVNILIAGGLGIAAGKKRSSHGLINTHMAFAIISAVSSVALFIIDIFMIIEVMQNVGSSEKFLTGLFSTIILISFISFILSIISASYCCSIRSTIDVCCGGCYEEPYNRNEQQVVYITNNPEQHQPSSVQTVQQGGASSSNVVPASRSYVFQPASSIPMPQQIIVPTQQAPVASSSHTSASVSTAANAVHINQSDAINQLDANQVTEKQQVARKSKKNKNKKQEEAMNNIESQSDQDIDLPPIYTQE